MRALIAEDEIILANNIKICLERENFGEEGFEVDIAENGEVALKLLKNYYDVVILDLKMPKVDGTHIIEVLNEIDPQKRPSVILITAYPGAYETACIGIKMGVQVLLQKPFELPELIGVIRELIRSRCQLLRSEKQGVKLQCNWTLALSKVNTAFIQVNGMFNFAESCLLPLDGLDSLLAGSFHHYKNFQPKVVGMDLFRKFLVGDIQKSLVEAGRAVLHTHNLKLTLVGPREHLQYPFEFLHDGTDYLILRHPMKRFVTGVHSRGNADLSHLLGELQDRHEKLRILLIASNTLPPIESVDEEVEAVYNQLKKCSKNRFAIDYLPTEKATFDGVTTLLEGSHYHILHYAGHGYHDERFPQQSGLFFWEKKGSQGRVRPLSVKALKSTLVVKGNDLRFVYLSCCSGTATGEERALLHDNYLGIADGLILAGIPSVLGFRWPISDKAARDLALAFYKSLFAPNNLDIATALFHARCKVEGNEEAQSVGDWLSPILIVQGK